MNLIEQPPCENCGNEHHPAMSCPEKAPQPTNERCGFLPAEDPVMRAMKEKLRVAEENLANPGGGISGALLMSVLNDGEAAIRGAAVARAIALKTFGKYPMGRDSQNESSSATKASREEAP